MIVGIGTDLVELQSFAQRLNPELINELFLPDEIQYCLTQRHGSENFAARFAAKEALFKALGAGLEQGLRWHQVEVCKEDSGAVHLLLSGLAAARAEKLGVTHSFVSLTHTRHQAQAMVVLENRCPTPEDES